MVTTAELIAQALASHPWDDISRSAHKDHNYYGACGVCRGDLEMIAGVVLPALAAAGMVVVSERTETDQTARILAGLHRSAEEDVTGVIELYERWVKAGPPPLGTSLVRWWDARLSEFRAALHERSSDG